MKIIQIDDVELISIKTKSLQDFDNEINLNSNKTHFNDCSGNTRNFLSKISSGRQHNNYDEDFEFSHEPNEEAAAQEEEYDDDDHYESSVRFLTISKSPNGACGFHLTRTKWDPYPWITAVDDFTPAATSDLKAGDCVLEVNGCDVLGLRIKEIAKLVKSSQHQVTLLVWSSSCNKKCDEESLCAAPMPRSLQRLSLVVQMILNLIECPVCLDTITPPAMQCQNGHLLCVNCRIRAEKCPVCRDRYFPRPALIAEQIQSAITSAFNLCRNEDKVRQKIFGRHNRQRQMVKTTLQCLQKKQQQRPLHKSLARDTQTQDMNEGKITTNTGSTSTITSTTATTATAINRNCDRKVTDKFFKCAPCNSNSNKTTSNKFLTKLLSSKAYSMENLTNGHNNTAATSTTTTTTTRKTTFNTCHTTITSAISQHELFDMQQQHNNSLKLVGEHRALFKDFLPRLQQQKSHVTSTNQFNDLPSNVAKNHQDSLTHKPKLNSIEINLNINTKLCCKQMLNNEMQRVSLSSDKNFTTTEKTIKCLLESPGIFMNDQNETAWRPSIVCETSYATIPRAIKLKAKLYEEKQDLCQSDGDAGMKTEINSLKWHSSSMTSLNLNLNTSSNSYCCICSCATTCNCQSSLSASASATTSSSSPASLSCSLPAAHTSLP